MKKIDKLVLKAFLGPFVLTFCVVVFVFLIQYLIKYFPDLLGKGLGYEIFIELLFYFSINVTPVSMPLAILISSLVAFGNLGEHFELTALKSGGLSMVRALMPIFVFSVLLCITAFYINNNIVPKANLKAFSLLYDIKQKKPTLEFKDGVFYNGLPGYSIRVTSKTKDGLGLKGMMIYNHTLQRGNIEVVLADSGRMYSINDNRYLVLELHRGNSYSQVFNNSTESQQFIRNEFKYSKLVFSLASFDMNRTREELFASNKIMRNVSELKNDYDSLNVQLDTIKSQLIKNYSQYYTYKSRADTLVSNNLKIDYNRFEPKNEETKLNIIRTAANNARTFKGYTSGFKERMEATARERNSFEIELYRKFTQAFACLVMFLIGAPLGSIIKKGGLGLPVLISICFFIFYYIVSIVAEKWAQEGIVPIGWGMWAANLLYLPIGLFFLRQAQTDSRILESDYFAILFDKIKVLFSKKNEKQHT